MRKRVYHSSFWISLIILGSIPHQDSFALESLSSFTESYNRFLPGHNLTPTSDVLKQGQSTVGVYALAIGVTNDLTLETSPWMIGFYNMPMLGLRYQILKKTGFQITSESLFFKTFEYQNLQVALGPKDGSVFQYQQTSAFQRITASYEVNPQYRIHLSSGHQYFWDRTATYSFYPRGSLDDYIASLSVLNEVHLNDQFGAFIEAGVLGLNLGNEKQDPVISNLKQKVSPYSHLGLSLFYQTPKMMAQLGVSRSQGSFSEAQTIGFQTIRQESDVIIYHPEIQLQWFL